MVRDSIEAKGDNEGDAEGAPNTTTTNGNGAHAATGAADIMQLDGAADGDLVTRSSTRSLAPSSTNRDSVVDGSANGDGGEEGAVRVDRRRKRGRRLPDTPERRLLELIDTTSKYLCAYQEA